MILIDKNSYIVAKNQFDRWMPIESDGMYKK